LAGVNNVNIINSVGTANSFLLIRSIM
jgi:hypothetical protein